MSERIKIVGAGSPCSLAFAPTKGNGQSNAGFSADVLFKNSNTRRF
jgi:hypothetical protein